jgi:ribosomal protein S18 acetylase RimI-like enzyme
MARAADQPLTEAGFSPAEGETCTLYAPELDASHEVAEITLTDAPNEAWLAARAKFSAADAAATIAYARLVNLISGPRQFAAAMKDGRIVAVAFGVISRGLLVVESVATDPQARRAGLGRKTVSALMSWGESQGAKAGCLQVVTENAPAHALYRSLGFSVELYRYHYRRGQTPP